MSAPRVRPGDDDRRSALESIRLLVGALSRSARGIEQRTGITNAQLFLLQQLAEGSELTVGDLAERARTNQSTVSIVVAGLVRARLVRKTRSAADARSSVLGLTAAGRRLVRRAPAPPTALLLGAVEGLSAREVRELASSLGRLIGALGLEARSPGLLFEAEDRLPSLGRRSTSRGSVP